MDGYDWLKGGKKKHHEQEQEWDKSACHSLVSVCHCNGFWKNYLWALHDSVSLRAAEGWITQKEREKNPKVASPESFIVVSITCTAGTAIVSGEKLPPKHPLENGQVQSAECLSAGQGVSLSSRTKWGGYLPLVGHNMVQVLFPPTHFPSFILSLRHIHSPPPTHLHLIFLFSNVERKQVSKPQELLVVLWSAWAGIPKCITCSSGKIKKEPQNVGCLFLGCLALAF